MTMTTLLANILAYTDDINENDMWVAIGGGYSCCPSTVLMCLVTVEDIMKKRHVVISQYDPAIGWSNLHAGEKVVAWMPLPEACKGENERARIERKDNRVYYIDDDGNRYVIYRLVDFDDQLIIPGKAIHYMAAVVEVEDGGRLCGYFYIEGDDDDDLLECCKQYVH